MDVLKFIKRIGKIGPTESASENESENEEDSDEESGGDSEDVDTTNDSNPKCKCRGLPLDLLKRVSRKNPKSAGLESETRLLATLETFIEGKIRLRHVCFKQLKDFGVHFELQVKNLDTEQLRGRLSESWKNRHDLDTYKLNSRTKT